MTISTGKFKLNRLLLSLVIIQIIVDLPFFFDFVLPQHDTQYAFQWFYLSYNNFFFFHELPRWVPFGFYGVQSDYFTLLPTDYLSIFIGKALRTENVLSLFKLSIFFIQMIFLLGTYLLARRLFKRGATIFIVCVITICSTVFYFQFHLNFAVLVYLPLILFFIHKFFYARKLYNLMIMLNILTLSLFGSGVYPATLTAMVITVFFISMLIANIKEWREFLTFTKKDLYICSLLFLTFIILIGTFYPFTINALDHTIGIYIGRDPVTKISYLESFLTYAGYTIGFGKFKGLVYPSINFVISGLTLHVGFLVLFFLCYALIFVRKTAFIAIAAVVTLFVLFSLGSMTPVAEFLYNYFPTMKYYRHIGHSVANLKLFLPLMAGFGIDHLLCRIKFAEEGSKRSALWTNALKIAVAAVVLAGSFVYSSIIDPGQLALWLSTTATFLLLLYLLQKRFPLLRNVGFFIAACVLFQMLSYRAVVDGLYFDTFKENTPQEITLKVNRYSFQPERSFLPVGERGAATLAFVNKLTVRYTAAYNLIQMDPCISEFRTDFLNTNVATLLAARNVIYITDKNRTSGARLILPDDDSLKRVLGCNSPKLKLFSDVLFFDDPRAAIDFIKREENIDEKLILNDVALEEREPLNGKPASGEEEINEETIKVSAFSANKLELDVVVNSKGGKWLYYADAWHPGWKVFVNGVQKPIAKANIAFKAVRLDRGENRVRFVFDNKKSRVLANLMIFFGILFVLVLLIFLFINLFRPALPEEKQGD